MTYDQRAYNRQWMRGKRAREPEYVKREQEQHKEYKYRNKTVIKIAEGLKISYSKARELISNYTK